MHQLAGLHPVHRRHRRVRNEPVKPRSWVYFPNGAIISVVYVMENGASVEIAIVGNDGLLGVALFMGGSTMAVLWFATRDRRGECGWNRYESCSRTVESCSTSFCATPRR